jgi:hypothetical protein
MILSDLEQPLAFGGYELDCLGQGLVAFGQPVQMLGDLIKAFIDGHGFILIKARIPSQLGACVEAARTAVSLLNSTHCFTHHKRWEGCFCGVFGADYSM